MCEVGNIICPFWIKGIYLQLKTSTGLSTDNNTQLPLSEQLDIMFLICVFRIPGNKWALEQAKRNLVNNYFVVGVTEELEDFVAVLEASLPRFFKGATEYFSLGEVTDHALWDRLFESWLALTNIRYILALNLTHFSTTGPRSVIMWGIRRICWFLVWWYWNLPVVGSFSKSLRFSKAFQRFFKDV